MVNLINYDNFFYSVKTQICKQRQRALLLLSGDKFWLKQQVKELQSTSNGQLGIYVSNDSKNIGDVSNGILSKNYRHLLGTEQSFIVFYGEDDFNVDAFAALSGTLISGGILILCLESKLIDNSLFLQRFVGQVSSNSNVYLFQQTDAELPPTTSSPSAELITADSPVADGHDLKSTDFNRGDFDHDNFRFSCVTAEQEQAVSKILHVVQGHRDRPLVLTADRGRGKSSALAIACAELLKLENKKIIITAPHPEAVVIFFSQLLNSLPGAKRNQNKVTYGSSQLCFIPLDVLQTQLPECHLLLVDEAAGIPLPNLRFLLQHYHRQVFVSTIHGYEGAGRGFSGKFLKELKQIRPQGQLFHINEPIRWSVNEPVEQFIFNSLMLNADLPTAQYTNQQGINYRVVKPEELITDENLLNSIFSLLVTAHYQTKPSDLKMLLDNKAVSIVIQQQGTQLLGVVLMLAEGDVDENFSQQVKHGRRRLKGHFIPQSLLVHNGIETAFNYRYRRIIRIAIHPQLQNQGLGSQLLNFCVKHSQQQDYDFIGTSFGINIELLNFWLNNHFQVARIGFSKDAASGEHSALMMQPLTEPAKQLMTTIGRGFSDDLSYYLTDEYQQLPVLIVLKLLQQQIDIKPINDTDLVAINDFAMGYRQYSCCAPALRRWLLWLVGYHPKQLQPSSEGLILLVRRVIQQHSWQMIVAELRLTGKKQALLQCQTYVTQILALSVNQ